MCAHVACDGIPILQTWLHFIFLALFITCVIANYIKSSRITGKSVESGILWILIIDVRQVRTQVCVRYTLDTFFNTGPQEWRDDTQIGNKILIIGFTSCRVVITLPSHITMRFVFSTSVASNKRQYDVSNVERNSFFARLRHVAPAWILWKFLNVWLDRVEIN